MHQIIGQWISKCSIASLASLQRGHLLAKENPLFLELIHSQNFAPPNLLSKKPHFCGNNGVPQHLNRHLMLPPTFQQIKAGLYRVGTKFCLFPPKLIFKLGTATPRIHCTKEVLNHFHLPIIKVPFKPKVLATFQP